MLKHLVGLAVAAGMIGTAQADYITGFETTDNAGYVAGSAWAGVDGWSLIDGNGTDVKIVNSHAAGGTQSAAFGRATIGGVAQASPRLARSIAPVAGDTVTISVRLAFDRVPGTATSNAIYFGDSSLISPGTGNPGNAAVQFGFARDGSTDKIVYYKGGTGAGNQFLVAPVINEFYEFTATADLVAKTYDLTVKGSNIDQTITDIPFRQSSVSSIDSILVGATSQGTTMRLDNLAVTPEPGTLGLLGLGTVMMLARRR